MAFGIIDPINPAERPGTPPRLTGDRVERTRRRDLRRTAAFYRPSAALVDAINVAVEVGAPLLLTGQPGTGKTQVAFYLKWYLGLDDEHFHVHPIRSTSKAHELTYSVDEVRYFHAAQTHRETDVARRDFVEKGPLWKAYDAERQSIVLIDEIDKAPRDFPNDLLFVLDQHRFRIPEYDAPDPEDPSRTLPFWVERQDEGPPPIIVITSNSERRLPDPFLRRCIFHHIRFTRELLRTAVHAHLDGWANVDAEVAKAVIDRSMQLRERRLRKPPSTAEIILWLSVLDAMAGAGQGVDAEHIRRADVHDLPALSVLVKDADDLAQL